MRLLDRFRLTHRVWTVVLVYWLVFLLAIAAGLYGMKTAHDSLEYVHDERMRVSDALTTINRNFWQNRLQVLLAFQHDPNGPLYAIHDHNIDLHFNALQATIAANDEVFQVVLNRSMSAEEQALVDDMQAKRRAWQAKPPPPYTPVAPWPGQPQLPGRPSQRRTASARS